MTSRKRTPSILILLCIASTCAFARGTRAQTRTPPQAQARTQPPEVLGIRLGMPMTVAKPFIKKISKLKSCKVGPWEQDGSATLSCEGLTLTMVPGKSADELLIAAMHLSTSRGGSDYLDKVTKKNGPACASSHSSDAGGSDFWGYDENGVRAPDNSSKCMPQVPEDLTFFWSANEASCAPGDHGSYIFTRDFTSYYRHSDDLGVEIRMLGCGMLAKAKPQLLPIPPRPRNQ